MPNKTGINKKTGKPLSMKTIVYIGTQASLCFDDKFCSKFALKNQTEFCSQISCSNFALKFRSQPPGEKSKWLAMKLFTQKNL